MGRMQAVMPAQAGIQVHAPLDPGFRRGDGAR
jgi:hypothetical protein